MMLKSLGSGDGLSGSTPGSPTQSWRDFGQADKQSVFPSRGAALHRQGKQHQPPGLG